MKDFFDQHEQHELPQEFQWENMEAGIMDKMAKIQAAEAKSSRPFVIKKRFFVALIFGLSIPAFIGLFYNTDTFRKTNVIQEIKPVQTIDIWPEDEPSNPEDLNTNNLSTAPEPAGESENEPNIKTERTVVTERTVSTDSSITIQSGTTTLDALDEQNDAGAQVVNSTGESVNTANEQPVQTANNNEGSEHFETYIEALISPSDNSDSISSLASPSNSSIYSSTDTKQDSLGSTEVIDAVELGNPSNESNESEMATSQETRPSTGEKKNSAYLRNQFGLEVGLSIWNEGSGQSLPERDKYESNLISSQIQGYYMWSVNSGIFLMAGFQFQQLQSKLNYRNVIPEYELILTDTVIRVYHNMSTGDFNEIYGDVAFTVQAERLVIHYNTTSLLKLSLGGGKSWSFNSFQTDIYGGLGLNTVSFNRGRTIINNELINYEGSSNEVMKNNLYLEAFAGARIHYFVSPQMAITGGLQIQRSLMNWSMIENGKVYPLSLGLNIGLSYTFE